MKITRQITIVMLAMISVGCDRKSTTETTQDSGSQRRVGAETFNGEVYRALNGSAALSLISVDECELKTPNGTLLCKYTKKDDTLRLVATAFGTNQVLYYRYTPQGLMSQEGTVLLSQEVYQNAMSQIQRQRAQEEEERRLAEVKRLQEEDRKRAEKQRIANIIRESKKETTVLQRLNCVHGAMSKAAATLTDVSIKLEYPPDSRGGEVLIDVGYFTDFCGAEVLWPTNNTLKLLFGNGDYITSTKLLDFKTADECNKAKATVLQAYKSWKEKFPEAAR